MKKLPLLGLVLLIFSGCAGTVQQSSSNPVRPKKLMLVPISNATPDLHAGPSATEIVRSVLLQQRRKVSDFPETLFVQEAADLAAPNKDYLAMAKEAGASHVITGTIHEYRYTTDYSGRPAVGITLRLIDVAEGKVLWQATGSSSSLGSSSLTEATQKTIQTVLKSIPLQ